MKRNHLIAGVILATVAGVAGTYAGRYHRAARANADRPSESESSGLYVPPGKLNFGEVWEQPGFEYVVPVENRGEAAVTLSELSGSCDCIAIEPRTLVIPPRETREIKLKLDLRPKDIRDPSVKLERPFAVGVWGQATNAGVTTRRVEWYVEGKVRRAFDTSRRIEFGRVSELASLPDAIRTQFRSAVPVREARVRSSSDVFTVRIAPSPSDPCVHELIVSPRNRPSVGSHDAVLSIEPVAADGRELPPVEVVATLVVVPDLETLPDRVDLGVLDLGTERSERLVIRSVAGKPFTVEKVATEGSGLSMTPDRSSDECAYFVRIVADQLGPINRILSFTIRSDGVDPATVRVSVRAHGIK